MVDMVKKKEADGLVVDRLFIKEKQGMFSLLFTTYIL